MSPEPLETLFDASGGETIAMPSELTAFYGTLRLPRRGTRTRAIGNFVETLDGVVSLNIRGHSGGGEISGNSRPDRAVMGILRAAADAVVVGAGTLRSVPGHVWTSEQAFPEYADGYRAWRATAGKPAAPLNVIVTAKGDLDPHSPVFSSGQVEVLIVTGRAGYEHIRQREFPSHVRVEAVGESGPVEAQAILDAINRVRPSALVLVEGGPHLIGDFMAHGLLDELFLTLAPQIAGRSGENPRPGLVEGEIFAMDHSYWGDLLSVKRATSHLFLRYALPTLRQG